MKSTVKWLDSITDSMDMNLSKLRNIVKGKGAWRAAVHPQSLQSVLQFAKSQTQLSD